MWIRFPIPLFRLVGKSMTIDPCDVYVGRDLQSRYFFGAMVRGLSWRWRSKEGGSSQPIGVSILILTHEWIDVMVFKKRSKKRERENHSWHFENSRLGPHDYYQSTNARLW